ncbi:MAG TPA: hypothetical protein VM261_34910 [Kofleriaceae bacterium]|nr:hypothetical protein [Kofleriaceae bacterium]
MTRALGVLLLLVLAACDEDKAQAKGSGPPPNDDALIAAWKKAGLEVSPFTDADAAPYSAQSCRAGTVGGVDVVVCSYDTGEDASAAQDPALALLEKSGATTASALARGKKLLVVTDKRKADPTGRSINAITGAFRK